MKRPKHPTEKPVMIISDYPILNEIERDIPYSAPSNLTLFSDLYKVGIKQSDCYSTYLSYERPEKESFDFHKEFTKHKNLDISLGFTKLSHQNDLYVSPLLYNNFVNLLEEIKQVKPKLIIVTGKWSLFFLTGSVKYTATQGNFKSPKPLGGLNKYRASIMQLWPEFSLNKCVVMPILPTTTKQRDPSKVPVMGLDYKKLGSIFKSIKEDDSNLDYWLDPNREDIIGISKDIIIDFLHDLIYCLDRNPVKVSIDIETRHNTVDCIGFSYNKTKGLVIPFSTLSNPNPWSFEDELEITRWMLEVLNHKNLQIVGQNFSYDSQYLNKFYFVNLHPHLDTMIANHVLYNYMPKDLSYLASIYCDTFSQWKDMQTHEVK